MAEAQLAAVRSMPWAQLRPRSIHLTGLTMRYGKEVLIQAALHPEVAAELSEQTSGLVGPVRRLQLFQRLSQFDIQKAIGLLSSSDLYQLSVLFWNHHGTQGMTGSVVAQALENELMHTPPRQAEYFGGYHPETYGCIHPHLVPLGPYEDFENLRFATNISERLSHLLLNLAESADSAGVPSDALALLAEAAVREVASKNKMNDKDDWTAALEAMSKLDIQALLPGLEKMDVSVAATEK